MTRKKLGCYAALVFENCHSKERSSDLGHFRCLATVRVGCENFSPFSHPGFTELLVEFTAGSAEDQSEIKAELKVTTELKHIGLRSQR